MAACVACSAAVFVGEERCPSCGRRWPAGRAADGAADGRPSYVQPGDAPPADGLDLVLQKELADQSIVRSNLQRDEDEADLAADAAFNGVYGMGVGYGSNEWADLLKAERDHDGRIVWDTKSAIYGGIVLVILAVGAVCSLLLRIQDATSGVSHYSGIS